MNRLPRSERMTRPVERDLIQRWQESRDHEALDAPLGGDPGAGDFYDVVPGDDPSPEDMALETDEARVRAYQVGQALTRLDAREREIIRMRYLDEDTMTLSEVGREIGVCRERVRQIEAKAIRKMRRALGVAA